MEKKIENILTWCLPVHCNKKRHCVSRDIHCRATLKDTHTYVYRSTVSINGCWSNPTLLKNQAKNCGIFQKVLDLTVSQSQTGDC